MNKGAWYLLYSITMDPSQGESVREKEIALDSTTEDAAIVEASEKLEAVLCEQDCRSKHCYVEAEVVCRIKLM